MSSNLIFDSGTGMVFLDYAVTVLLWLAALLQVAIIRDHSLPETRFAESCRWIIAAGIAGIALRFSFVLYDVGDVRLPAFSIASLAMVAVGLIGRSLEQLRRPTSRRRVTDYISLQ